MYQGYVDYLFLDSLAEQGIRFVAWVKNSKVFSLVS